MMSDAWGDSSNIIFDEWGDSYSDSLLDSSCVGKFAEAVAEIVGKA